MAAGAAGASTVVVSARVVKETEAATASPSPEMARAAMPWESQPRRSSGSRSEINVLGVRLDGCDATYFLLFRFLDG